MTATMQCTEHDIMFINEHVNVCWKCRYRCYYIKKTQQPRKSEAAGNSMAQDHDAAEEKRQVLMLLSP